MSNASHGDRSRRFVDLSLQSPPGASWSGAPSALDENAKRGALSLPRMSLGPECYRMFTVLEMMPPVEVVPKIKAACKQALSH